MKELLPKAPIIRPMTENDVEDAAKLEERCFSMPWKAADFAQMISAPYAHYFVAKLQEKTVGIIGLRELAGDAEITNVAVDESCRRRGIGRMLVSTVMQKCDELGINDVTLEVRVSNLGAIALYKEFGFESEGIRPGFYDNPNEDALILWRRKQLC